MQVSNIDCRFKNNVARQGVRHVAKPYFASQPPEATHHPAPSDSKGLSYKELMIGNGIGVAGSLIAGFATGHPWLGILGMWVVPIPVLYGMHLLRKLRGLESHFSLRFDPGIGNLRFRRAA